LLVEYLGKKDDGLKNNQADKNASDNDKRIEDLAEELHRIYK